MLPIQHREEPGPEYNGLRNSIVYSYGNLDMGCVVEVLNKIDRLCQIVAKLALIYESMPASDASTARDA
ncbi:MAG TPA: hypothetical protein ENF23_03170 [Methanosarcinales archaeon]|nr:hypothetical protein [Methanosarcinales archaeon]